MNMAIKTVLKFESRKVPLLYRYDRNNKTLNKGTAVGHERPRDYFSDI